MKNKKAYLWSAIGRFLPQAIYLVTTMVLARFLTPEDFGAIGVLTIFFSIANTLMDSGLGGSLVKEKEISKLDCSTIACFNVVVSVFLYILLFVFSNTIERHYQTDGLAIIAQILCLIFVINSFGQVPRSLLIRDLRFRTITIITISAVIVSSIVAIIMAILGYGVWSLVAYQLVNAIIGSLLSITTAHYRLSFKFSWNSFKRLYSFGVFTTLTTTIDTIYENIIVNIFGKGFSIQQAGYLSQAKKIEEAPSSTLTHTISNVAFPVLAQLRDNEEKFNDECVSIFKIIQLPLLPLMVCIALFAAPILHLVFGPQWVAAAPYLSLLVIAGIFRMAETLNRTFIKATTVVDELFFYTVLKRIVGIGIIFLCLLIDKRLVLIGYVISTFIGYVVNAYLLSRICRISFWNHLLLYIGILFPSFIFYLLVWGCMHWVSSISGHILFSVLLLVIYYLFVMPLFGINTRHLIKEFQKR